MWIKGIYKLPELKHAFIIVSSLSEFQDNSKLSKKSKRRVEYFEKILRSKDQKNQKSTRHWTLKVMSENDFVRVLSQNNKRESVSSNQPSHSPEYLELLAINLLRTSEDVSDWTYNTPKVLSSVPEEDIIEVFI